jgi:hypothetical protein
LCSALNELVKIGVGKALTFSFFAAAHVDEAKLAVIDVAIQSFDRHLEDAGRFFWGAQIVRHHR